MPSVQPSLWCPIIVTAGISAACNHNVFTPPARAFPLETPPVVEVGAYGVQVEGSATGKNPSVGAGALRIRRGVDEGMEVTGELTYARNTKELAGHPNPNFYAARAGVKFRPEEMRFLGVTAGAGAGTFAGGPFASLDAGAVVGYEGCKLSPFVSGWGYVSKPLDARPVDATEEGMPAGSFVDTPETTAGVQVRAGIKINLSSCEKKDKALVVGFGFDHLWDDDSDRGLASGGAALEFNLR
jgi:hypothetical protein